MAPSENDPADGCRDATSSVTSIASNCAAHAESSTSDHPPTAARPGDIVTLDLSLIPEDDFVPNPLFDTEGQITFVLGWGNYLPGLHELVSGMAVDQQYENVSIDAGYGKHRPELVVQLTKDKLWGRHDDEPFAAIRKGSTLELEVGSKRRTLKVSVVDTFDDSVVVDANPPLAGASYSCRAKLLGIDRLPELKASVTESTTGTEDSPYQVATFALGCFWGGELAFMRQAGVVGTKVGYTGGRRHNSGTLTYQQVCEGTTRHREAVMVVFDSRVVSYETLLQVAFQRLADTNQRHNPKQITISSLFENDEEESWQYRHGIYYHSVNQQGLAAKAVEHHNPFRVEVLPCQEFFDAEEEHRQYLLKGGQSARKGAKEPIRCFG